MGELKDRIIRQTRDWLDGDTTPVPPCDWNEIYPVTVYDAIRRSFDTESTTLTDEIEAIYRLINDKQTKIEAGTPGNLMTWSGIKGQIGSTEVLKKINDDSTKRSLTKIPSERAVGDKLDAKTDITAFNAHAFDNSKHITDTERTKWNSMAPLSNLQTHMANENVHVTESEKTKWNSKAEREELEQHIYDLTNPHNVNAHQVDAYTRREVDEMFSNLQASFFNYVNISWDSRTNVATLVKYHASNWNPNYVLKYGEELPTPPDNSSMYFALVPATDYRVDESQECILWIKKPGLTWQEVGMQPMQVGDMVIKYPEASMYVWTQGRFILLFTDNNLQLSGNIGGNTGGGDTTTTPSTNPNQPIGSSDLIWRPTVDDNGNITWTRSNSTAAPAPVNIKGKDGYTPIKGVDYFDGNDGQGVPVGGYQGEVLVKLTDDNYDTTWKSLNEAINELVIGGMTLPAGIVKWDDIVGKPVSYNTLGTNDNGFVTQRGVTEQFDRINDKINDVLEKIEGSTGVDKLQENLSNHIDDFANPHRVTATQIGAVTNTTFLSHAQDFDNPHNVTPAQIGLGNVDNTSDLDKPISNAVQDALDQINTTIKNIIGGGGVIIPPGPTDPDDPDPDNPDPPVYNFTYIYDVKWDPKTSSLIFSYNDGEDKSVSILLEDTFKNISYDIDNYELVFVLPDGSEHRVDFSQMAVKGSVTSTIQTQVDAKNTIKASIVPNGVGQYEIASSVNLRGAPTTTTQTEGDNSTRIATTEFVHNQVIDNLVSYEDDRPLSANMGRLLNQRKVDRDEIQDLIGDIGNGLIVVDSLESTSSVAALSANMGRNLNLIKAPRVHTSRDPATYGAATSLEFGHVRMATTQPLMDGTVFIGTDNGEVARADHKHPTDISRAPVHFPDNANNITHLTGKPMAECPPNDSRDDRIATTDWVRRNAAGTVFGRCNTDSSDPIKEVIVIPPYGDPPGYFKQQIGSTIAVLFANTDTSGHSESKKTQLQVGDNPALPVLYCGSYMKNNNIVANMIGFFVCDGNFWHLVSPVNQTAISINNGPDTSEMWPEITIANRIYTIVFNPNNGTVDTPKAQTNKWGRLEGLPVPTRENYNFRGWFTALEGGDQITDQYTFEDNMTVYARWSAAPKDGIHITFNPMKGSIMTETVTIANGQPIGDNLMDATRENYKFLGWFTKPIMGGERVDQDTVFTSDTTLYARWQQDTSYEPINMWTGYIGKVVRGDGTVDENGCCNYVQVTKQYDITADDVRVDISSGDLDFSVEMADQTQQPATNPKLISYYGGVVKLQFQIGDFYPLGEGGVKLQYSNKNAYIRVMPKDEVGDVVDPGDIKYPDAPVLTNPNLPGAQVGVPYNKKFEAEGETPIYWIITEGALPPGLYLDMEQGIIAGTPTAAGRYPFNVQGINNSGTLTASMFINVEYEAGYEE